MRNPYTHQSYLGAPDAANDGPTVWFMKKYWWVSIPVVLALTGRFMERKRKKTLSAYNLLEDFSNIAAPGLGALGVIALIRQEHADALAKAEQDATPSNTQSVQGYHT